MDVISPEEIITYEFLVQGATHKYGNIVDSEQWGTATGNKKSKYHHSLPKSYTMVIEKYLKKALKQVDFKSRHSINCGGSGGW